MSSTGRLTATLVVATLLLLGCRGDIIPPETDDKLADEPFVRLTASRGDDRTPTWSLNGESVYYTAEGFGHLPPAEGVLVGLPSDGGAAQPILTNAQLPNNAAFPWFAAPVVAPEGDRVAFVDIAPGVPASFFCDPAFSVLTCDPERETAEFPPLLAITLRVRRFDATGSIEEDPFLEHPIAGVEQLPSPNIFTTSLHIVHDYPFQQAFDEERTFVMRPSWAPDGERIVFSDGLRLLIWTVSSAGAVPIPNTEDGVSAAWRPDGEWIAFSRFERADSSNTLCTWAALTVCIQERTEYVPGRRVLSLIRPDGSGLMELTDGEEPAWSPDGSELFYRHGGAIWRLAIDGSEPELIPGTQGGREPAVSPDGQHLAFAKFGGRFNHDIWVALLN